MLDSLAILLNCCQRFLADLVPPSRELTALPNTPPIVSARHRLVFPRDNATNMPTPGND